MLRGDDHCPRGSWSRYDQRVSLCNDCEKIHWRRSHSLPRGLCPGVRRSSPVPRVRWLAVDLIGAHLVMILVCVQLNVINPDVLSGRTLHSNRINWCLCFADLEVADDNVVSIQYSETNADKTCDCVSQRAQSTTSTKNSLPLRPKIEVFEPTRTATFPVIVPEIMTILGASPVTAVISAARVVTMVTGPPRPPEVLEVDFNR